MGLLNLILLLAASTLVVLLQSATADDQLRRKRSPQLYDAGLGLGFGLGGLYGGYGLGGIGGGLGGFGGITGGYPSAYPGNYVGFYDSSPSKLATYGDSYANQNYKPYAIRASYGGYSSGGAGRGRYKRSAFIGPTVGYGAAGFGGYGLGLGGLYGGYGLGLGLGLGGFGGGLGGFGGITGGYPSAYPGNYVGFYDSSPVKLAATGDSYANQNYKPYALRAAINGGTL